MTPRIVGGSNYDNPYAKPLDFMPKSPQQKLQDKLFEAFDDGSKQLQEQEVVDDPLAQVKAEFEEAQRRQREPKSRKGVQT